MPTGYEDLNLAPVIFTLSGLLVAGLPIKDWISNEFHH